MKTFLSPEEIEAAKETMGVDQILLDDQTCFIIELGSTIPGEPLYRAPGYVEISCDIFCGENGADNTVIKMAKKLYTTFQIPVSELCLKQLVDPDQPQLLLEKSNV